MANIVLKVCAGFGGVAACAGVALGALSAHALKTRLDATALATLHTVSWYCLVHGLALIVLTLWLQRAPESLALKFAALLFAGGLVFFCGGLSASMLSGMRAFGSAAPFGGMAFMLGWLTIAGYGVAKL